APSFATLPASARTARADMLAAVDRFYAAMNAKSGVAPPDLAQDCSWTLNGLEVSTCEPVFTSRRLQPLEQVRDIKVIAVDEARGLVAVSTYEDFPATQQQFTDASGTAFSDQETYPRTQQVVELFRFANGRIEQVHAITSELPYGMKPR